MYPVLPLSLDCLFLFSLRFSLTLMCPVSCIPSVIIFSGLSIPDWSFGFLWRLFVLCLVYSVLPLSLDCPFLIGPSVFSDAYLSCVLCTQCSATIVSGLSIPDWSFGFLWRLFVLCLVYPVLPLSLHCPFLIRPSVFSDTYLSCVLCTQSYHCLPIVHSWLVLRFSLTLICPVLCTQCYNCLWIVHSWLVLRFSLTLICPVSCVPSPTIVTRLYIPDWSFGFLWRLFVLYLV